MRLKNQLRIHWHWLKDKSYEEVFEFIEATLNNTPQDSNKTNKMTELLKDMDELLGRLEDFTHGKDGEDITRMRHRIIEALKQPVVSNSFCVCEGQTGGYRYGENDKTKCSTCGKEKQTDLAVSGSALVDVNEQGIVKLPKDCGMVTTIVYDNYKSAKIVEVSPNYDFFRLEFWEDDNPKQVTINWITPSDYKSRFSDDVETHYR